MCVEGHKGKAAAEAEDELSIIVATFPVAFHNSTWSVNTIVTISEFFSDSPTLQQQVRVVCKIVT